MTWIRLLSPRRKPLAYHKAIELDPQHALAYSNLGNALLRHKKVDRRRCRQPEGRACRHAISTCSSHMSYGM
jgi:hypothetical protein